MSAPSDTGRLIARVAGLGLRPEDDRWVTAPLPATEWVGFLQAVQRERITGLLQGAIESGRLPVTEGQRAEARATHRVALHASLVLEAHLLRVVGALDAAGIGTRVLKGAAVAHLDHRDPADRTFRDIDLLVRSVDFDAAVRCLTEDGTARRRYAEIRPGFDRRFGKGACVVHDTGLETDLHRTLAMGPFGLWVDEGQLWGASEPFEVGGRTFEALGADLRLVHACYHVALDLTPRLVQLRDVAEMVLGPRARAPLDDVRSIARAWRGEVLVASAVALAWQRLELPDHPIADWARARSPSRLEARALAAHQDPRVGFAARSILAVRAVRGWQDKIAFVRALAFPSSAYGAGRHAGRAQRWRAATRELGHVRERTR